VVSFDFFYTKGSHTDGKSLPVGEGKWRPCNIMEMVVNIMQCFQ
jgi:hypothetical protein